MSEHLEGLPKEPVDRITKLFARFLRIEAAAGAVLLFCTVCAIGVANSAWSAAYLAFWETPAGFHVGGIDFSRSLKHWINDGLMTLFFFIVSLELKRELVLGELRHLKMAFFSLAGALGGMVVPASLYLWVADGSDSSSGWGVVMATDTAFVIGCLAIVGSKIPLSLRLFLLSLAIFDDLGAILVVAIGYGGELNGWPVVLAVFGLAAAPALTRLGVRNAPIYYLIGMVVWLALDASGIHATLAGVALGLLAPARGWVSDNRLRAILGVVLAHPRGAHWGGDTDKRRDLRRAGIAAREALSPVERLELALHPWVAFAIIPVFALANAAVTISPAGLDAMLAAAIMIGFVVGKPLGVVLFCFLAVRMGMAVRPPSLNWSTLTAGSLLTGIGFTMALFIAELAFQPALLNAAKLGILGASVIAGTCGLLALLWVTSRPHQG